MKRRFLIGTAIAVSWLLLLFWVTDPQRIWVGHYCKTCGLMRSESGYDWLGRPFGQRVEIEHQTDFHLAYTKFVSTSCSHTWHRYSRTSTSLAGRGKLFACGQLPRYLEYSAFQSVGSPFANLGRLDERTRAATILRSFSLANPELARDAAALAALAGLEETTTAPEAESWWEKHRALFPDK